MTVKNLLQLPTLSLLMLLGSLSGHTLAEDRYVSDKLYVPLRSGMGTEFRITHRGIPSGTKLKLIEAHEEDGWSLVETEKGEQGWVRNQYIEDEPIAKLKLASANEKIASLETQRRTLQKQLSTLKQGNQKLQTEYNSQVKSAKQLDSELSDIKKISSSAVDLHQRHQNLTKEHQLLQTKADVLQAENTRLAADRRYREWLYGAGILILGIIATLVSQSMSRRKRFSEWG